jgi:hypothetical protein
LNDPITLGLIAAGAYIGWKILVAAIKGLAAAGSTITTSWPAFFEKVWVSVFSGVAAGLIIGVVFGGDVQWASGTGMGITAAKIIYDLIHS